MAFNPIQIVQLLEEIVSLYNTLKADGTLTKLVDAEQSVQHELENNAALKDLLAKLGTLKTAG